MKTNEEYRAEYARRLEAKVRAVNKANAEANRLHPIFVEAFRSFVGTKILTHSGLAQKPKAIVEQLLAPFVADGYKTPHVFRHPSNYALTFCVKTCESSNEQGVGIAAYHETYFTVGELDGYNLKNLNEHMIPQVTSYTAESVRAKRKAVDDAERALRDAQSALGPFGRYDN